MPKIHYTRFPFPRKSPVDGEVAILLPTCENEVFVMEQIIKSDMQAILYGWLQRRGKWRRRVVNIGHQRFDNIGSEQLQEESN